MALRHSVEMALQVGQDQTLDEKIFDGAISLLIDTCEHAEAGVYTLAANELNVAIGFGDVALSRLIWIEADGDIEVSIGGTPGDAATLLGAGGTFPTNFAGGEAFSFEADGVAITGTFLVGDQSLQACVNRINAAAMLAGLAYVPMTVVGGQMRITGALASEAGTVDVLVANATIGFPAITSATGTDASGAYAPEILVGAENEDATQTFYCATVRTSSLVISNREAEVTNVRVCIVGDVTT